MIIQVQILNNKPDLTGIDLTRWEVVKSVINPDFQGYTVELRWVSDVPFQVTNAQGKLMLLNMGFLNQVSALVSTLGEEANLYFNVWPTWERTGPLLLRMAGYLGWNEEQIDQFFIEASKLR